MSREIELRMEVNMKQHINHSQPRPNNLNNNSVGSGGRLHNSITINDLPVIVRISRYETFR